MKKLMVAMMLLGGVMSAGAIFGQNEPVPSKAGVSAPVVVKTVDPQFSEQARSAGVGGDVLVGLTIDEKGVPTDIHIIRGVGYGLDEKAIEAVEQYRFKPAMRDGHPVVVKMNIAVNFKIYKKP